MTTKIAKYNKDSLIGEWEHWDESIDNHLDNIDKTAETRVALTPMNFIVVV